MQREQNSRKNPNKCLERRSCPPLQLIRPASRIHNVGIKLERLISLKKNRSRDVAGRTQIHRVGTARVRERRGRHLWEMEIRDHQWAFD